MHNQSIWRPSMYTVLVSLTSQGETRFHLVGPGLSHQLSREQIEGLLAEIEAAIKFDRETSRA